MNLKSAPSYLTVFALACAMVLCDSCGAPAWHEAPAIIRAGP